MSPIEKYDCIVIGAGVCGSASAYHLAKMGKKSLLIEQFSLHHDRGSSHGASRIIRYAHTSPIYLPLADDAFKQWDEIGSAYRAPLYNSCGLLWLGDKEGSQVRANVLRDFGVSYEFLEAREIRSRFPHFHYTDDWYAVYDPKGGYVYADRCLEALQSQYRKFGGRIRENERVISFEHGQVVKVITDCREYLADSVIVACGAFLPAFLPEIPLKTTAELVGVNFWHVEKNQAAYQPHNKCPVLIISKDGEELFMIPNVDYPNQIKHFFPFGVHLGTPTDPYNRPANLPSWTFELPSKHIAKYLPDVDASRPASVTSCLYTMTGDGDFILDRHPLHPNVIIGGGFSGTGFKFGPTTGKILARMAVGMSNAEFDLTPFKIDRHIGSKSKL